MWQYILCVPLFACIPNLSFAPTDKNLGCWGVTFNVSRSGWSVWTTTINPLTWKTMIQIHFHKHSRMHIKTKGGHLTVYIKSLFIFVNLTLENWFSVHMTFTVGNASQIRS